MRMKEFVWADAMLVGPEVDSKEVSDMLWPYRPASGFSARFDERLTKSGNRVLIPVLDLGKGGECNPKLDLDGIRFRWPIIPLIKYRGGYMTATAIAAVEWGQCVYRTPDYETVERKGKYVRTRHRVVYADRNFDALVVDVLLRPDLGVSEEEVLSASDAFTKAFVEKSQEAQ